MATFWENIVKCFKKLQNGTDNKYANRKVKYDNKVSREVVDYPAAPIEAFLQDEPCNILISGDNDEVRNRVMCASAYRAMLRNRPVIILHFGNHRLEDRMRSICEDTGKTFYCINSNHCIYDPLAGFQEDQYSALAGVLADAVGDDADMQFIQGLAEYCKFVHNVTPTWAVLKGWNGGDVREGSWTGRYPHIAQLLGAAGEYRANGLYRFFQEVQRTAVGIGEGEGLVSAKMAIEEGQVFMIDLVDSTRSKFINLIMADIKQATIKGKEFSLVLDGVPADASPILQDMLEKNMPNRKFTYAARDVWADASRGGRPLFDKLMSGVKTVIVQRHSNSVSAATFSEIFGKYRFCETNRTMGASRQNDGKVLTDDAYSDTSERHYVERNRVEEHDISTMRADEFFLKTNGQVLHSTALPETAESFRIPYGPPEPNALVEPPSPINWTLFAILFLVCAPIALIYSYRHCGRVGKVISVLLFIYIVGFFIVYGIGAATGLL